MNTTQAAPRLTRFQRDRDYLLSEWKQMLNPKTIPQDLWAGITVALVALPLNLALAIAAGVEPGVGITTGIIAGIIGALFGGQRFAITGPAAAMAVVLIEIAETQGINAIWLVCLAAGLLQIIAGVFKLGKLISYMPMPVIVGFANAIGVLVFFNALDDFLGLPTKPLAHSGHVVAATSNTIIPEFLVDITHMWTRGVMQHEANWHAILIGTVSFAIAFLTPKLTKAIPGQLIAIVAATLCATLLNFHVPLIKDISHIPNVLPTPSIPGLPWDDITILFPTIITVFMLGSIESLLSATVADGMTSSRRHNSNQELIGQGLANVIVPFFGGIPVTGVIARTAVNIRAGAQTRLSALVHSITLIFLIFFLARYAEQIPLAALASILMLTGIRLVEWDAMREIWRGSRLEGYVMLCTTVASVAIDLTAGVFAGVLFACVLFIRQMSEAKPTLHDDQQQQQQQLLPQEFPTCKAVRTYVVDGPLFFGAAQRFIDNIVVMEDIKVIVLHMRAAKVMDLTGVETLLSIHQQLKRHGGKLIIAELPIRPMQLLERTSALEKIGRENVFADYRAAMVSVNQKLLDGTFKSCTEKGHGTSGPKDCPLRNALLDESSPMARMLEAAKQTLDSKDSRAGLEWLFPVNAEEDIPTCLKSTPIEKLVKGQNLGIIEETSAAPECVIGMCIDFRKSLSIPRDWAFIIRREGANMQDMEFGIALALSKGVRHMALIAHNHCAMANTAEHRDNFVEVLSKQYQWTKDEAGQYFDKHARTRDIGNEIDFVMDESRRIEELFPTLMVVPFLFRVEDDRLYLIHDWLIQYAADDPIMRRLDQRDTGEFRIKLPMP